MAQDAKRTTGKTQGALDKFEPGQELGPTEGRNEHEQRLNSLPPEEREMAEESSRFADLCQYFSEHRMDVPPDVLAEFGRLQQLAMRDRTAAMKRINQALMEYLDDVGQDHGIRQ
jgi:hypothetical protein